MVAQIEEVSSSFLSSVSLSSSPPSLVSCSSPLAMDIEWAPNFRAGQPENPVSLVQLSDGKLIVLVSSSLSSTPLFQTLKLIPSSLPSFRSFAVDVGPRGMHDFRTSGTSERACGSRNDQTWSWDQAFVSPSPFSSSETKRVSDLDLVVWFCVEDSTKVLRDLGITCQGIVELKEVCPSEKLADPVSRSFSFSSRSLLSLLSSLPFVLVSLSNSLFHTHLFDLLPLSTPCRVLHR